MPTKKQKKTSPFSAAARRARIDNAVMGAVKPKKKAKKAQKKKEAAVARPKSVDKYAAARKKAIEAARRADEIAIAKMRSK